MVPKGRVFHCYQIFGHIINRVLGESQILVINRVRVLGSGQTPQPNFSVPPRYVAYIREHPGGFKPLTSLESSVERHIFFSHCWLLRSPTPMKFSMTFHMGGVGVFVLSKFNSVPTCFIHFCSYGSQSIPSPFHLSWLCLVEYLDLFTDEEVSY